MLQPKERNGAGERVFGLDFGRNSNSPGGGEVMTAGFVGKF
jgi:hypothetical protein